MYSEGAPPGTRIPPSCGRARIRRLHADGHPLYVVELQLVAVFTGGNYMQGESGAAGRRSRSADTSPRDSRREIDHERHQLGSVGVLIVAPAICFASSDGLPAPAVDQRTMERSLRRRTHMKDHAGWTMIYFVMSRPRIPDDVHLCAAPSAPGSGREDGGLGRPRRLGCVFVHLPGAIIPLGFFSEALWVSAGAYQLVALITAMAGAAVYQEAKP